MTQRPMHICLGAHNVDACNVPKRGQNVVWCKALIA
jgi:hypothetical protein